MGVAFLDSVENFDLICTGFIHCPCQKLFLNIKGALCIIIASEMEVHPHVQLTRKHDAFTMRPVIDIAEYISLKINYFKGAGGTILCFIVPNLCKYI